MKDQVWRRIAFKRDKHDTLKYVICIDWKNNHDKP